MVRRWKFTIVYATVIATVDLILLIWQGHP